MEIFLPKLAYKNYLFAFLQVMDTLPVRRAHNGHIGGKELTKSFFEGRVSTHLFQLTFVRMSGLCEAKIFLPKR